MKEALFTITAIISYIIAINLSMITALIVLLIFMAGCIVLWIPQTFNPSDIIASATTGKHIIGSNIPIVVAGACFFGGFIGLTVANEEWQYFFLNLLVPKTN